MPNTTRVSAIDLARGIAIVLMILSHGTNGLLTFEQFTDWGLVPLHAITKMASSLFILVFGIALAVAFVPKVDAPDWPRRRWALVGRGLLVLFWYKLLTMAEMVGRPWPEIRDALLYVTFPSYVEILGFYAIALLWLPWLLPAWARAPLALKIASPVVMALAGWWLYQGYDFGGVAQVQALVVEHPDYYTWGQLSRGPLVLVGLLIGGVLVRDYADASRRRRLAAALAAAGVALLVAFAVMVGGDAHAELDAIARNAGKHPPETAFMLWSIGGALVFLAIAFAGGERLARVLKPVTVIGTNALQAFAFHIVVIFVVWRHGLGWLNDVTYGFALGWTIALIAATSLYVWLIGLAKRRWRAARAA